MKTLLPAPPPHPPTHQWTDNWLKCFACRSTSKCFQEQTDRQNLAQTCQRACSPQQSLDFQQTSTGCNDEPWVSRIRFPGKTESGEVVGGAVGGGLLLVKMLLICPTPCRHLTNFTAPFKRPPALAPLYFLQTPSGARSMQMSGKHLKEQSAPNEQHFGDWYRSRLGFNRTLY